MAKDDKKKKGMTKRVQDRHFAGIKLDKPLLRGATTGEEGLRELSEKVRDSDSYGTPLSKGAISAGNKKLKDAPLFKRLGSPADRKKLDKKAAQAAREAGAEERREARGMKKGGTVSASKRADGIAVKGKTKGRMV